MTAPPAISALPAGEMLRRICRAYREAAAAYDRAFVRGDVNAIEEAFSRMQEIARAFDEGSRWADCRFAEKASDARRPR
ncbi:MAG TPA: hypothetical protein VII49_01745 [Rhizomicrobium sp.]